MQSVFKDISEKKRKEPALLSVWLSVIDFPFCGSFGAGVDMTEDIDMKMRATF